MVHRLHVGHQQLLFFRVSSAEVYILTLTALVILRQISTSHLWKPVARACASDGLEFKDIDAVSRAYPHLP